MAISVPEPRATASEPLAIIGFAFKFPSNVSTAEAFWQILMRGDTGLTETPEDRFNLDAFRNACEAAQGKGYFIDKDIKAFDAPFFSITAEEAMAMDPQQRLLLETAYHAIENAGLTLNQVNGSKTSVHVGCLAVDYKLAIARDAEMGAKYSATGTELSMLSNRLSWFFNLKGPSLSVETACSSSLVALDLACQLLRNGDTDMGLVAGSSLMHMPDFFIHLDSMGFLSPDNRCHSFDSRANGYARAEGMGVLMIKRLTDAVRDGDTIRAVIRASCSNSDGYTPGITQPSGESQLALIRETYLKAGLSMHPTRYCEAHGTGTALGDPIEAHAIGAAFRAIRSPEDPLYIGASKANLGHMEAASGMAGIIKTILVLERATIPPIADLKCLNPAIDDSYYKLKFPVKAVPWPSKGLRRASVNSFGFGGTNAHVVLDDAYHFLLENGLEANHNTKIENSIVNGMKIHGHDINGEIAIATIASAADESQNTHSQAQQKLPPHEGANGHHTNGDKVSIDAQKLDILPTNRFRPYLLTLTAADREGVKRIGNQYSEHFNDSSNDPQEVELTCHRLAFTLEKHRSPMAWRSFAVVDSLQTLSSLGNELSVPRRPASKPCLAYVLTGQGAQWAKMGIELMQYPIFASSIRRSAKYLAGMGCPWDLEEELRKDASSSHIDEPDFSQPLSSALQIALVDLLEQANLKPAIVIGHSSGEVAAAYCKGAINQQSAMKIAYFRGMGGAAATNDKNINGTMMAVGLGESDLKPVLQEFSDKGYQDIHMGCINSPKNVTVSGDAAQLDMLKASLDEKGIFARKLKVSCAYHSPHMIAIAKEYVQRAETLDTRFEDSDRIPMISYLNGEEVSSERLRELDYWMTNTYSPVQFTKSVGQIDRLAGLAKSRKKLDLRHRKGLVVTNILEVGPHCALKGPLRDIFKTFGFATEIQYDSALVRGLPALDPLLRAMGSLQCSGLNPDISYLNGDDNSLRISSIVDLPAYPFAQSRTYWHENSRSKRERFRPHKPKELLGTPSPDGHQFSATWRRFISRSQSQWIDDHNINSVILYPAAGMLAMAIEAMDQYIQGSASTIPAAFSLKDVDFISAMHIPEAPKDLETQIHLRMLGENAFKSSNWVEFNIFSCEDGQWKKNCKGLIRAEIDPTDREHFDHQSGVTSPLVGGLSKVELYEILRGGGYMFGPTFQRIENVQWSDSGPVQATIKVFKDEESNSQRERTYRAMDWTHIIHPATLDAFLQVPFTNIIKESSTSLPTMVPTRVKRLWLSRTGLNDQRSSSLAVTSWLDRYGYRGGEHSLSVTDSENIVRAEIMGYEVARVSGGDSSDLQALAQKDLHHCWKFGWKPLDSAELGHQLNGQTNGTEAEQVNGIHERRIQIHLHDPTSAVIELATALQAQLQSCYQAHCEIIDLMQMRDTEGSIHLKIILWDLDRQSILSDLTNEQYSLVQKALQSRDNILWVQTESSQSENFSFQHLIDGLSRVLRQENDMSSFATLSTFSTNTSDRVQAINRVCQTLFSENDSSKLPQTFRETSAGEIEVAELEELTETTQQLQSAQIKPVPSSVPWDVTKPLKMVIGSPGVLDTMHFVEDVSYLNSLQENEVEIEVKAVGLNFKDCLIALGALNEKSIGSEVAGIITRLGPDTEGHGLVVGDRVCGFSHDGYRTFFRNHAQSFSRVPPFLTFAEAASIPINFATAWHSLRYVAQLEAGETVLIHSGAGGTGQAAIQVAQSLGAIIYATVGTNEKRELLVKEYGIPPGHIFNSRDASFVNGIKRLTNGNGVDVVFNSLSGDILFGSWDCLAPFGRFVEIGKKDIQAQSGLPMAQFEKNCSFSAVDLGHIFQKRPKTVTKLVNEVLVQFEQGKLRLVHFVHSFNVTHLVEAFRVMQSGKSSGKIVVEMHSTSNVQAILVPPQKSSFGPDGAYVIAGGLGGLGRDIARWLASKGAKHLVLLSRSGPRAESAQKLLADMKAIGVNCIAPGCDISDRTALATTLEALKDSVPQIRGCFQATMVLRSNVFMDMAYPDWIEGITSKVAGSWNLHSLLPKDLDFFILLSSCQGLVGSRTQGNYAAGNTFMDALAQHRVSHGWKAVSLQLGLMESDGYLAEHENQKQLLLGQNTYLPVGRPEFHALLDYYCDSGLAILTESEAQVALGLRLLPAGPAQEGFDPEWARNPMFRRFRRLTEEAGIGKQTAGKDFASQFVAAASDQDATAIVLTALTLRLATTIAGIDPEEIDTTRSVQAYGVDSLQTMELRSWFVRYFRSDVPTFEILGAPSLNALAHTAMERSLLRAK